MLVYIILGDGPECLVLTHRPMLTKASRSNRSISQEVGKPASRNQELSLLVSETGGTGEIDDGSCEAGATRAAPHFLVPETSHNSHDQASPFNERRQQDGATYCFYSRQTAESCDCGLDRSMREPYCQSAANYHLVCSTNVIDKPRFGASQGLRGNFDHGDTRRRLPRPFE